MPKAMYALDQLDQRLLDANRTIGQASKITTIFGRKVTKFYKGKLQTVIEDLDLANPDVTAYGVKKAVENLPQIDKKLHARS